MLKSRLCGNIWKNAVGNQYKLVIKRLASFAIDQEKVIRTCTDTQTSIKNRQILLVDNSKSSKINSKYCQIRRLSSNDSKTSDDKTSKYQELESNYRADPEIKTLDTPQFKSILKKNVLDLMTLFHKHNYEIRVAGGAVR